MKQSHYINYQLAYLSSKSSMSDSESSEIYSPDSQQRSEQGRGEVTYKRRLEKTNKNTVEGKWTDEEHLKYVLFMIYHLKTFVSKEKRKSARIFKTLSELLGTRTPRQCRSHFQKIMNKFKKVNNLKNHYMAELGPDQFERQYALLVSELEHQHSKSQDSLKTEVVLRTEVEVQTDPIQVTLGDLSNTEIIKLMNLLQDYQKIQLPFFMPPMNLFNPPLLH